MTRSIWGDTHLFFRHQLFDDDVNTHPSWGKYATKYCPIWNYARSKVPSSFSWGNLFNEKANLNMAQANRLVRAKILENEVDVLIKSLE
jgi:hypothetical protein